MTKRMNESERSQLRRYEDNTQYLRLYDAAVVVSETPTDEDALDMLRDALREHAQRATTARESVRYYEDNEARTKREADARQEKVAALIANDIPVPAAENRRCQTHIFSNERWDGTGHQCSLRAKVRRGDFYLCARHQKALDARRYEPHDKWHGTRADFLP